MRTLRTTTKKVTYSTNSLEELSFVLYLCIPALTSLFNIFMPSLALASAITITYLPITTARLTRRRQVSLDFWGILFFIISYILITYLIHPNYEEWYTRDTYGVWDYVLRPDNGIYIYLFIRALNSPNRIIKCIRKSGWVMLLYYGYRAVKAIQRGYWIDTSNHGYEIHMSYNLGLGYHVLFFTLVFLYCGFEYKEIKAWVGAIAGIIIIGVAGSRGPFLCILMFLAIYLGVRYINSSRKIIYLAGFVIAALVLWIVLPHLLSILIYLLDKLNIPSRVIRKLANGSISDDSRRHLIWNVTIQMILKNPIGYGAMGSRFFLSSYVYAGYPHNLFLELLIDYGVFGGMALILIFVLASIRIFLMRDCVEWRGLFIVFFANACQLLISLTYWHTIGLWSTLAMGVCVIFANRMVKIKQNA